MLIQRRSVHDKCYWNIYLYVCRI